MALQNVGQANQGVRDELGSEPSIQPIYVVKTENIKTELSATQVGTTHIGHAFTVGHPVNGIIGTANGLDGQQITIGTGGLGTREVIRVVSPNNRFIDRFYFDTYISTGSSTTTIDTTNGKVKFS
jgi:hypothetical protein